MAEIKNDKPEVIDAVDELANLFGELGRYDKKIHDLRGEIAKADEFIDSVAGSDIDRAGLEYSLGMAVFRKELKGNEDERNEMIIKIAALEGSRFGEEIPRDKDGKYKVPWDAIRRSQAQVDNVMRKRD